MALFAMNFSSLQWIVWIERPLGVRDSSFFFFHARDMLIIIFHIHSPTSKLTSFLYFIQHKPCSRFSLYTTVMREDDIRLGKNYSYSESIMGFIQMFGY